MTARRQLWIVRLVSVPALLFLPISCIVVATLIVGVPKGDSIPTAAFLGLIAALAVVFPLSRRTVFACIDRLPVAKRVLYGLLAFDIVPLLFGHVLKYFSIAPNT